MDSPLIEANWYRVSKPETKQKLIEIVKHARTFKKIIEWLGEHPDITDPERDNQLIQFVIETEKKAEEGGVECVEVVGTESSKDYHKIYYELHDNEKHMWYSKRFGWIPTGNIRFYSRFWNQENAIKLASTLADTYRYFDHKEKAFVTVRNGETVDKFYPYGQPRKEAIVNA